MVEIEKDGDEEEEKDLGSKVEMNVEEVNKMEMKYEEVKKEDEEREKEILIDKERK